jgi:2',3'-cyclic-nucleotide 2'-phosphodiesterase (5'-nucleotidase family)
MPVLLTILHNNDLHGEYGRWLKSAALIKERRSDLSAKGEKVLLLDGGDHMDMSINECLATGGHLHLEMLAELGVHAITPGNNELLRSTVAQIRELSLASKVPWLLTNLLEADGTPLGGMKSSLLIDLGDGVKVGMVGATDQFENTYEIKHGLKNADTVESLRKAIGEVRAEGAKTILFLSHLGYDVDQEMAKTFAGEIDVIIGAHSHTVLEQPTVESGVVIVQAGALANYLGELQLELDDAGTVIAHHGRLHPITEDLPDDEAQALLLAKGREQTEAYFAEVLTTFDHEVTHSELITQAAEAMREYFGAEVGMMLGAFATDGFKAGDVTMGDVYTVCKSMMNSSLLEMQGQQFLGLIRESQNPEIYEQQRWGNGFRPGGIKLGQIQFTGLTYDIENGEPVNVMVNGEPLDPERWYKVGTTPHMHYANICGYPSLEGSKMIDLQLFTVGKNVFINYLRERKPVTV